MLARGVGLVLLLSAALPAAAIADTGPTVTATGIGQAPVTPKNLMDDASIRAAVAAAHQNAIPLAIADARVRGTAYAAAAGWTLGAMQSVSDVGGGNFAPFDFPQGPVPFPIAFGPGGITSYCGIARTPIFRQVGKHRKLIRVISHKACYVPATATATLTVTYAASVPAPSVH
jgi:hypothetical protein